MIVITTPWTYPSSARDLRRLLPAHSWPQVLDPDTLAVARSLGLDIHEVQPTAAPEPGEGEGVREIAPVLIGQRWTQQWEVYTLPPPPVPDSVAKHLFRAELRARGLLAGIDASVGQMGEELADMWATAPTISLHSHSVEIMRQALGLTTDQRDDIFRAAAERDA